MPIASSTGKKHAGKKHAGKKHAGKKHAGKKHAGKKHAGKKHAGKKHALRNAAEQQWPGHHGWPEFTKEACQQRAARGWASSDVWNFDVYLAGVISGGVEALAGHGGTPYGEDQEQWEKRLHRIAKDLRLYARGDDYSADSYQNCRAQAMRALKDLRKVFGDLWT
jgi:hypothetical protein